MRCSTLSASLRGTTTALLMATATAANASWSLLNMTPGVTSTSKDVYDLHMLILWICVVIGIVVFGVMFWSIVYHRHSRGAKAAQFHHSTTAEILWTSIPFAILVVMAVPATRTLIAMEDTSASDLTIKVTGYQWKWRYDYLEEDVSFYSNLAASSRAVVHGNPRDVEHYLRDVDNPVVVPVGRKIRFLLTADDVIHAWWVPALGVKKDAIPGFINEIWVRIDEDKVGIYRGQCAELCGRDHGFMPIVVDARSQEDYDAWVEEQNSTPGEPIQAMTTTPEAVSTLAAVSDSNETSLEAMMARGKDVYVARCAACHLPNGAGLPPTFPAITGSPIATGAVAEHLAVILHGRPGTAMIPFGPQLDDRDMAAVMTYQRNALGNSVGDLVHPADVAAAR